MAAPMMGTPSRTWNVVCAANWTTTTGQLAAVRSPPRFNSSFRSNRFHYSTRVSCDLQPLVSGSPTFVKSIARIAAAGLLTAGVVGAGGFLLERARLGPTDQAAVQRIEDELGRRFAQTAEALTARALRVRANPDTIANAPRDTAAARSLFQALSAELTPDLAGSAGITVYNARGNPLAWAGRVSDVPRDRIDGPSVLFVSLDPLGPRLVRVEPVPDPLRAGAPRLATIVAEQLVVERTDVATSVSDTFRLPTSVVDVNVRATPGLAPPQPPFSFAIRTAQGQVLATAEVSPAHNQAARSRTPGSAGFVPTP